jgi:hypothetical protein
MHMVGVSILPMILGFSIRFRNYSDNVVFAFFNLISKNTILEVFSTSTSYIECRQEQFWGDVIVYDLKYYHVILNLHLQSLSSMLLN